ncbi:MAG TPA: limonene-1,2-epoxide hydrolase family protein [Acidimicrobiia bacterium]|nr:limonene-1,2-epoxide hydrolase family protein [Acidimicrobiia bacterium]
MSEPSAEIDLVRAFFKALQAMDLDEALSYMADNVEYQNMPLPPVKGHQGVLKILGPMKKRCSGFEVSIRQIASNGRAVLTERTDAVFLGPVRIPFQVCGTFEIKDGKITVWRDTFDWASGLVNTVIAGPLYAFRRVSIPLGMKIAMKKAERAAAKAAA